ncbi:DUF2461 domain-containing protein [Undibacterium fentianense]|uniref:DUF2461 domain-containing protein n=1 Tax=Undibacterium fentianense TaxID=2828728 RepID=A0A941E4F0_9BURK|nr:DUF2461 domain-containing protein [Undibacterium fentianense]MBR7800831.1 DUF2461 domain-containing protein [Undibacterium fentianense]
MHIAELSRFLFELSENNNRAWFVMNKPRYDILRAEFLHMVTRLIQDLSKHDLLIAQCDPKKALFRINRDVRFGKDKSPYKTYFSASILPSGRKKPSEGGGPAYYFQISQDNRLLFAVGEYMPPADRLRNIRTHLLEDEAGFKKVLKNRALKDCFGELQEEGKLQRPPKGYDPDHALIEYLKLKSMMVWTECSLEGMLYEDVHQKLVNGFKTALPLVRWLRGASFS